MENVYLGGTFSAAGSFTEAKSELYKKGLKTFYKLRTSFCDSLPKVSTFQIVLPFNKVSPLFSN
jgi:hypothetical protein